MLNEDIAADLKAKAARGDAGVDSWKYCKYCGERLKCLYPSSSVPWSLRWGHTSFMDAELCERPNGEWPVPA